MEFRSTETLFFLFACLSSLLSALRDHPQILLSKKKPAGNINQKGNVWISFDKILLDSFECRKWCSVVHSTMTISLVGIWGTCRFKNFYWCISVPRSFLRHEVIFCKGKMIIWLFTWIFSLPSFFLFFFLLLVCFFLVLTAVFITSKHCSNRCLSLFLFVKN